MWLKDETRSFIGGKRARKPGEPFEVDGDVGRALLDRYDTVEECDPPMAPIPEDEELDAAVGDGIDDEAEDDAVEEPEDEDAEDEAESEDNDELEPDLPVHRGGGYWHWQGANYRYDDLPEDAVAALEDAKD